MTTHEFNNQASQAERRRVERDSYLARAQATEVDQVGGRYKPETTVQVNAVPQYPALPASSPWSSGFDQNVEPAFGVDINSVEANGTPVEVKESIQRAKSETESS